MSPFSETPRGALQLKYLYRLQSAEVLVASPRFLCRFFLKRLLGDWGGHIPIWGQMRDALCRL